MFEKEESEDIIIEWDHPKPERALYMMKKTPIWYKRLKPFLRHPGRRGRIDRGYEKWEAAHIKRNNIVQSLRKHDDHEKWKLETAREDDGTYSIWCTYEGRMNEEEFEQRERTRAARYDQMKRQMLRNKMAKQSAVARSTLSASLRPPTVR